MDIKGSNAVFHNRFDIVVSDAATGKVVQRGQAENIVLDRIYTRLCNFQSFFDNIVFGTGAGTPTPDRSTLFARLGYKAATTEEVIRSYPNSKWVRKIRLDTLEYNGSTITEVGISHETTNVNTHALITDAEGNPLSVEKDDLRIVDIYATVFIEIPNIDGGLYFVSNGWRDYLTGGSAPNNNIAIFPSGNDDAGHSQSATRTADVANKRVKVSTRLNENALNKDIRFIDWQGVGLRCKLPRIGIFEGKQRNDVQIGIGDGVKTKFPIPNMVIENLIVKVEDIIVNNWTLDSLNNVVFDSPIGAGLIIKASYLSRLMPKNINNVLDASITIQYSNAGALPSPLPQPDYSNVPGSKAVIAGTMDYGFFGEVSAAELFSGDELASLLELTAGISQNSDAGWLKVIDGGKMLLIAKKTFRHTISWNNIDAVGVVWGKKVAKDGVNYLIRLLSTAEWNRFMYPLHVDFGQWAQYTDADLSVASENGRATWTSTPSGSDRVNRGRTSVSDSNNDTPSDSNSRYGFRPVLEVLL